MPSSSSRAAEYRLMIEDILAEDAALRARGLPGLEEDEIMEMRGLIARSGRRTAAGLPGEAAE